MAAISIGGTSMTRGTPVTASIGTTDIEALVTDDAHFADSANWDKVFFKYQISNDNTGYKDFTFKNDGAGNFADISAVFTSHSKTGTMVLKKVVLVDFDGEVYFLKGSQFSGMDITVA